MTIPTIEQVKTYIGDTQHYPLAEGQLESMLILHFDISEEEAKKLIKEATLIKLEETAMPCKFANNFVDWVPMPFGSGNTAMPGFECTYEGDKELDEDIICNESKECLGYESVPVLICEKHNMEYLDICISCEIEADERYNKQGGE